MAFLLLCSMQAWSQFRLDSVRVYYRVGQSRLDPSFHGNDTLLSGFMERVRSTVEAGHNRSFHFRVKSYASLEGPLVVNQRLHEARTEAFLAYLQESGIVLSGRVGLWQSSCYNWEELRCRVEGSDMPFRSEVLDILLRVPEWGLDAAGHRVELRKKKLMELEGGVPFRYMLQHFFPEMRYSSMQVFYEAVELSLSQSVPLPEVPDTSLPVRIASEGMAFLPQEEAFGRRSPWYMAIKTNLLYDALAVPNIGAEFYLGKEWTLGGNWMYAWWKSDRKHNYWRVYGGDLSVRKYLGRCAMEKPLQGHHVGVYGGVVTYDFELGGRGYLGDKWSYHAGIEYGYSHPVARRLNVDFTLGIGYLGGEYKEYLPTDNHYVWQVTKQRRWFGPTKAEISLVWLIGRGNTNEKGGKR